MDNRMEGNPKDDEKFEDVNRRFGFYPYEIINEVIDGYTIDRYIGHGTSGVVFHAKRMDIGDEAVCKIIPLGTLKNGWETELRKLVKLNDVPQVVHYKGYYPKSLTNRMVPVVCILHQYVKGSNLRNYAKSHPEMITLEFVKDLIAQSLHVFHACMTVGISHGDLHENNILIADPEDLFIDKRPRILIDDFGAGLASSRLQSTDDYQQLGRVCTDLIRTYIDPAELDGENRYLRDRLIDDFLPKQLAEDNPTVGDFVRNPAKLLTILEAIKEDYLSKVKSAVKLQSPFDYLSCEQIGDSFELLQALYSSNFPGYETLLERTNTILTGPRGCGKTTIFRNLSLKTQLLVGKSEFQDRFIGIYYNCSDLYYAFPYSISVLDEATRKAITHYFNLAVLTEILNTFIVLEEKGHETPTMAIDRLEEFLQTWFKTYERPPTGASVMRQLLSVIIEEKENIRTMIDKNGVAIQLSSPLPPDFLKRLCGLLQSSVPWLRGVPFFFFLDDYSLPRVSKEVQATLNCFIFTRCPEFYFKISTESILSIYSYDATGKVLEVNREYDVIDLGLYFLSASHDKGSAFLREVVNSRLREAVTTNWKDRDIAEVLSTSPYRSYNDLAFHIQKGEHVKYCGWGMVVDLCTGDIANMLRLIRNMLSAADARGQKRFVKRNLQDKAIREMGSDFLNRIEAVPDTGRHLREVVQAFGDLANHYIRTRSSKNVKLEPPMQTSRIELFQTPHFDEDETKGELAGGRPRAKKCYDDLIKFGIFIQDVRGKSQSGAVVPRLYLRRLLLPTFVLTPSKRDSIRLSRREFKMLLTEPKRFVQLMSARKPERDEDQERLPI